MRRIQKKVWIIISKIKIFYVICVLFKQNKIDLVKNFKIVITTNHLLSCFSSNFESVIKKYAWFSTKNSLSVHHQRPTRGPTEILKIWKKREANSTFEGVLPFWLHSGCFWHFLATPFISMFEFVKSMLLTSRAEMRSLGLERMHKFSTFSQSLNSEDWDLNILFFLISFNHFILLPSMYISVCAE